MNDCRPAARLGPETGLSPRPSHLFRTFNLESETSLCLASQVSAALSNSDFAFSLNERLAVAAWAGRAQNAARISHPAAEFDRIDAMPVRVIAHFNARPETADAVREVVTGFIEPTRKEAGCISYVLMQNDADPLEYTFVEEWVSNAALDTHLQTPHLAQGAAKLAGLLSKPGDIRRYTPVA
jgi:quinol monooxygenase YgiN